MTLISKILRKIGSLIPPKFPHASALGNRILKPVYNLLVGSKIEEVKIWGTITIQLDPTECVGGNIFFGSHIYDLEERIFLSQLLNEDSVFIDLGANIGAYSLWASKKISSQGHIISIEADPETFKLLSKNVEINNFSCKNHLINKGVSDSVGILQFYRHTEKNIGGNSFFLSENLEAALQLPVSPLFELVHELVSKIDVLKIDIEGFEFRVLLKFFSDCKEKKPELLPEYIMIEMSEGPLGTNLEYINSLKKLFKDMNYTEFHEGKNAIYRLMQKIK